MEFYNKEDKVDGILGIVYINATKDELMELEESELDIIIDKIWEEINNITTEDIENYYKEHGLTRNLVDNQLEMWYNINIINAINK